MIRRIWVFFLIFVYVFSFSQNASNTSNCKNLDKKRLRIDQENRLIIKEPVNVYLTVNPLIDSVQIAPSKDNVMSVKVDVRLHLETNINNFTVDVKKRGESIMVETNIYPYDTRLLYCEKKGEGVIYIKLPLKNIKTVVFKGAFTKLFCKGISSDTFKVKSKYREVFIENGTFKTLSIKTYQGDIVLNNVNSDRFYFYGGLGNVRLSNTVFKICDLSLLSGDVESFGAIEIYEGKLKTTYGDIILDLKSFNSLHVKTKSGDILLAVRNPQELNFSGETQFGDIYLRFKDKNGNALDKKKVSYGEGKERTLTASTVSGDIEIRDIRGK